MYKYLRFAARHSLYVYLYNNALSWRQREFIKKKKLNKHACQNVSMYYTPPVVYVTYKRELSSRNKI